jgi:dipeptidyl aminopeptidase/acylaminoacyl peptidase
LIQQDKWLGPSILLAPAAKLMYNAAGIGPPSIRNFASNNKRMIIVHGDQDSVVPLEHSTQLYNTALDGVSLLGNKIKMVSAGNEDHALSRILSKQWFREQLRFIIE